MKAYEAALTHGRFETWTEVPAMEFFSVHQVHGAEIVSVETLPAQADGLISSFEDMNKPLAIKTADCLPIAIEGNKGVVLIHAGWRGLALGILKRPEVRDIEPKRVVIGPAIHACCFEVSSEFYDHFPGNKNFRVTDQKHYFNLVQEAKDQLTSLHPEVEIVESPLCTSCEASLHSYRRGKQTSNRNWNLYIKG